MIHLEVKFQNLKKDLLHFNRRDSSMLICSDMYIFLSLSSSLHLFLRSSPMTRRRNFRKREKMWRRAKEKKGRCEPRICHQADTNWAACNLTECTKRRVEWRPGGPRRWSGLPLLISLFPTFRAFLRRRTLIPTRSFSLPTAASPSDRISRYIPTSSSPTAPVMK